MNTLLPVERKELELEIAIRNLQQFGHKCHPIGVSCKVCEVIRALVRLKRTKRKEVVLTI